MEPVGVESTVSFGWRVNDNDANEIQTARQVLVASSKAAALDGIGDVWDSGKSPGRGQNRFSYLGPPLESDRRYYWRVRTWDRSGEVSPWSEASWFHIGLLDNKGWEGAYWIRREPVNADDHSRFRRVFPLPPDAIERAVVYLSAAHRFELRVNGTPVGKGPAIHYPDRQYYHAYDVTSLLEPDATNSFAVRTHWFGGGQGRPAGEPGFILKAVVTHSVGAPTVVATDGAWKQSRDTAWVLRGLEQRNSGEGVGYVECIDARKLEPEWWSTDFDDSTWSYAQVIGPHPSPPWEGTLNPDLTRIVETEQPPESVVSKGGGKYVIDIGRVWAGTPRIRFPGGWPGRQVTMRGGYELNEEGEIPQGTPSQSTSMEYRAILSDTPSEFAPREYLGMRYFQIDNAPMEVTRENFGFVTRHSTVDYNSSSFASSDQTLNAVWEFMKHSLLTCAQEQYVDTPTREKGGFLRDAVIQSSAAMPTLNERVLTRRTLSEYLDSMDRFWSAPADRGRINAVYPNNDGARDIPDFTLSYLPWVWNYYMETGDRSFLEEAWPKLEEIGGYLDRHIDSESRLITKLTGGKGPYLYGIVDWPQSMRFGYDMDREARTVVNCWAVVTYETLTQIADELGREEAATKYGSRSRTLREAINKRLVNESGLYVDGVDRSGALSTNASQHANMLPLALGMVPEPDRPRVLELVKQQRMRVGMVTVSWLVRALGESDEGPALLRLFTDPTQPGWARCLERGATATWESWDADETSQSLSHAWGAAGLEGYLRYVLGIRPIQPQYERVRIAPLDFGEELTWVEGRFVTDRGPIEVEWRAKNDCYEIVARIPPNVTLDLGVPRGDSVVERIELDGKEAAAVIDGSSLLLRGLGSGEHRLVRFNER